MDWLTRLEAPQNALAILTAMITPAVLISACGALIFSTSTRLGRVDRSRPRRCRSGSRQLAPHPEKDEMFEERRELIFSQLDRQTSRARLIQRAMTAFYTALGVFVSSSVAIAIVSAAARNFTWVAVVLGLLGSLFMLYGSVLLIIESRMALSAIHSEMDFVWKVSMSGRQGPGEQADRRPVHLAGPEDGLARTLRDSSPTSRSASVGATAQPAPWRAAGREQRHTGHDRGQATSVHGSAAARRTASTHPPRASRRHRTGRGRWPVRSDPPCPAPVAPRWAGAKRGADAQLASRDGTANAIAPCRQQQRQPG